jgi:hypothetical protein
MIDSDSVEAVRGMEFVDGDGEYRCVAEMWDYEAVEWMLADGLTDEDILLEAELKCDCWGPMDPGC